MADDRIFAGGGGEVYGEPQHLLLPYGNRHGLIAGATGTGKTVTLQILAEGFSAAGVPVFLSDVKGDLSGIGASGSAAGKLHEPFMKRAATIGLDLHYRSFPVTFWDLFGEQGHLWQCLLTHVLRQGRLQLVLEVGFAGRRKERHGFAPLGWWFDRTSGSLPLVVSSTLVHEATMTLASRIRTGVKSATHESRIAAELNEGWPTTACGAATFSFNGAPK
jgi:hypothetical protein